MPSYVLLNKWFCDSHLYFENYLNSLQNLHMNGSLPQRCHRWVPSILEVRLFYVNMIAEEPFRQLRYFWSFLIAKPVSMRMKLANL